MNGWKFLAAIGQGFKRVVGAGDTMPNLPPLRGRCHEVTEGGRTASPAMPSGIISPPSVGDADISPASGEIRDC